MQVSICGWGKCVIVMSCHHKRQVLYYIKLNNYRTLSFATCPLSSKEPAVFVPIVPRLQATGLEPETMPKMDMGTSNGMMVKL